MSIADIQPKKFFVPDLFDGPLFKNIIPQTVGIEQILFPLNVNGRTKFENYPPRNIIRRSENEWEIQFATAGFSKENLSVSVIEKMLFVSGKANQENEDLDYVYYGIKLKDFEHKILIPEGATVTSNYKDGFLQIFVSKIPKAPISKQIEIK